MRVGIIGAGVAGLTTAKVLAQAGHEVVVHDKAPDVGGVWSRTRRYPGLTTQSPKAQYSLSDFPMPRGYPEWPTGEQIQAYLASYASHFGLDPMLRLSTEVTAAEPVPDGGWAITARGRGEHRRDRPAPAVEGAAPHRRRRQLQAAAADPHGRGPVQVPAPAWRREVPARPRQRRARPDGELDRHGIGPPG